MQPKTLVLNLLRVHGDALDVGQLIQAGEVFHLEPGAVRVALSRLSSAGLVERVGRGRWRMAEAAAPVAGQVDAWRTLDERVVAWQGGWVGAATGGLPSGRTVERQRRRALDLLGFRTFRSGLEVRPDNRRDPLRDRLWALGVEAPVLTIADLGSDRGSVEALWNVRRLERGYAHARAAIAEATERLDTLSAAAAARLTWEVGGHAIRTLALDPLLPVEMVDVAARTGLVDEMREFDDLGRVTWRALLFEGATKEVPT